MIVPGIMLVVLAAGGLLMRAGLAAYASGLARSKNAAGELMRSVCDLCVATVAFWAVGAAILLQRANGTFGIKPTLLLGWGLSDASSAGTAAACFFFAVMVLIASGIVSGALAERSRFSAVCAASALMGGLLIPVIGHWAWFGWLQNLGFIDVGGAAVLHMTGGVCAAVGVVFVGPRAGKYNRDGSANGIPGHSVPLVVLGVTLMVAAWVPYVAGASLRNGAGRLDEDAVVAMAAFNVLVAGASGGAAALVLGRLRYGKPDVFLTSSGALGGLVAISASAPVVGSLAAAVIGALAGVIVPTATVWLDLRWHLDDPSGGVAIHGVGGLWGTLAAGVFAPVGWAERFGRIAHQITGILVILVTVAVVSGLVFAGMKAVVGLRSKEADEYDGLDLAEHDINAYPDFQQTMIKSYHLREA